MKRNRVFRCMVVSRLTRSYRQIMFVYKYDEHVYLVCFILRLYYYTWCFVVGYRVLS